MTIKYKHRGSATSNETFPTLKPGEIAVNTATRQLAAGSLKAGSEGTPLDLLAVRVFDENAQYAAGDWVVYNGCFQRAVGVVAPGPFSPALWEELCPQQAAGHDTIQWSQSNSWTASDVGTPLRLQGTVWHAAQADAEANLNGAVLHEVLNSSTIVVQQTGHLEAVGDVIEGGGTLTPGEVYYLSATTAGKITTTAPSADGTYRSPVLYALRSDEAWVLPTAPVLNSSVSIGASVYTGTHSLSAADRGRPVAYYNGQYVLADASDNNLPAIGVLDSVVSATQIALIQSGILSGIAYRTFTAGSNLYLSTSSPGDYQIGRPQMQDGFSTLIARAVGTDTISVGMFTNEFLPGYERHYYPATAFVADRTGTNAPIAANYVMGDLFVDAYSFSNDADGAGGGTEDRAVLMIPCPPNWDWNRDLGFKMRIHWFASTSGTPGQTIRVRVGAMIRKFGDDLGNLYTFSTGAHIDDTYTGSTGTIQYSPVVHVGNVTGAAPPGDDKLLFIELRRMVSYVADTLVGGCIIAGVEIEFPISKYVNAGWTTGHDPV